MELPFFLSLIGIIVGGIIGAVVGWVLGVGRQRSLDQAKIEEVMLKEKELEARAATFQSKAETDAKDIVLKARDEALKIRNDAEAEVSRRMQEINREEQRLARRREELDKKNEQSDQRRTQLDKRSSNLDKREADINKLQEKRLTEIQRVAEMTREEARGQLLEEVEKDTRKDMARTIRQIEEEARTEGERRARNIVALAIQRVASEHVSEITVSVVPLPSDEMKGRIIGRNGRNIRTFEQAAGVDMIVDDTPEAVTVSSFDPIRREVAKRALSKLVSDGRIHPSQIEKLVTDAQKDVEASIKEAGEQAAFEAGVPGLHPEILRLLGRLNYRTSYGQNQNRHAIETSLLAGVIAAELGADVALAKAGGLLHDIGKALDHEVEGTHAAIGAEYAKRYGVNPKIVNAIAAHHHEAEQQSVEAIIVEAADAISGARPGARRESLDQYIKRIRGLEEIANSFDGVQQSFALQAGREVRIIVQPERIDDLAALQLSRNIARKIEETMTYPGQIRVTVIRETRATDFAK
ncbi:MAG: ribonuclease Y [Anaerolineales bacterium]|nr:ribonuclease Y [Anaerolineales bacterium]